MGFLGIGLDLLGIVVGTYIAWLAWDYLFWKIIERRKNSPRISFELFKEMYQLNPDIWSLDSSNYLIFNKSLYSYQRVEFNSYKDVLKYNNFRKKQRKNKYKQERYEAEMDLLKELQKEIDKYQKENIKEIKIHLENIPPECDRTVDKEFAELDENGEPIIADYYDNEEVNLEKVEE